MDNHMLDELVQATLDMAILQYQHRPNFCTV
jgi:hypothetical protein